MICPRCKEEVLVGNVCPVCGHIFENSEASSPSKEILEDIEERINALRSASVQSFGSVMSKFSIWLLPASAIACLVMALKSEAGLFWLLCIGFLAGSIYAIVRRLAGKMSKSDSGKFARMQNDMDTILRNVKRDFAHSVEMKKQIENIEKELFKIYDARKSDQHKKVMAASVLTAVIAAVIIAVLAGILSL